MSRHRACLNRASAKGKAPRGPRGKVSGKPREVPLLQAPAAAAVPTCCRRRELHRRQAAAPEPGPSTFPSKGHAAVIAQGLGLRFGWASLKPNTLKFSPSRPGVNTASWAQAHHYWIQMSTLSTKTTPLAQGTGQFLCTACETMVHRRRVSCWDCQGAPGHLGGWWVIARPPCQTQLWGSAVTVAGSGPSPAPQFPHLKIRDK